MPCKKCGKKWKWGEKGECKYDSKKNAKKQTLNTMIVIKALK